MKWKKRNKEERKSKWHTWFAWHPVTLDDGETMMWLELVKRRGYKKWCGRSFQDSSPVWFYEYKEWWDLQ